MSSGGVVDYANAGFESEHDLLAGQERAITRLRSELAAARAEREMLMGALNKTLDGLVFIQAHLAKVPNHDLLDKCSRLVMNVKTALDIDQIDDRLTFPNGTARHLDSEQT